MAATPLQSPSPNPNGYLGFLERGMKGFRFRLFFFIFLIYIAGATLDVTNTNPGSRFMLTKAIAKYGEFSIRPEDQGNYSYLDYSVFNGSIFSDKAPGISLLGVPIYWVGEFLAVDLLGVDPNNWQLVDNVIKFLLMLCVLAFGAFVTVKMYDLLRMFDVTHRNAHITAVFFGLGSLFYVYIGTLFSHGITAGFLLLALYHATRFRHTSQASPLLWSSLFSGYAIVCDYVLLFLLPFFFCYLFIPFPWNLKDMKTHWKVYLKTYIPVLLLYLIPLVLCGLLVLFYNFAAFGDPFKSPYSFSRFFWDKQHFANSQQFGIDVLVFSRHHGLLTFMPILWVSIFGLFFMLNRAPALSIMCVTVPMWIILLYSKYYLPTGGLAYGPRHLVSITPFLIIPLAFLLDAPRSSSPFKSLKNGIMATITLFLKLGGVILGLLTFLISFAGGWVGVYPMGGEGNPDPIWGTTDQIGHIEALLNWFHLSIEFHGRLSFDVLQGVSAGGFQLDFILIRFKMYLSETVASSLARGEANAFVAVLFLAALINPYFSPLEFAHKIAHRVTNLNASKNQKQLLIGLTTLLGATVVLFALWFALELIPPLGQIVRASFLALETEMVSLYQQIRHIPLLNLAAAGIGFLGLISINFLLFSTEQFTLGTLIFLTIVFLSVTTLVWIPFRQLHNSEKKQMPGVQATPMANNENDVPIRNWSLSRIFRLYRRTSIALAAIYLLIWAYIIIFKASNITFYSNLAVIVYSVLFAILFTVVLTPFYMKTSPRKDQFGPQEDSPKKSSKQTININEQENFYNQIPLIILVLLTLFLIGRYILLEMISKGMSLLDFLFLFPPPSITNVQDWFVHVNRPVVIFLTIAWFLTLVVALIALYPVGVRLWEWRHDFPAVSHELKIKMATQSPHLSRLQSILLFGGLLILLDYLLLTSLYATLSTVPDPTSLPKPWEAYPEEVTFLGWMILAYFLSLILVGIKYMQSSRSSSHAQTANQPVVDSDLVVP